MQELLQQLVKHDHILSVNILCISILVDSSIGRGNLVAPSNSRENTFITFTKFSEFWTPSSPPCSQFYATYQYCRSQNWPLLSPLPPLGANANVVNGSPLRVFRVFDTPSVLECNPQSKSKISFGVQSNPFYGMRILALQVELHS